MIVWGTAEELNDPHINYDADHLADALKYMLYTSYQPAKRHIYECDCSRCGFRYYTEIKQCNCPHCGCDGGHFRCSELK